MELTGNILLIGGSGILSSDICKLAIERGIIVTIANRGKKKEFMNPKARMVTIDIRRDTVEALQMKLCDRKYDVIVDFITFNLEQLKKTLQVIKGCCNQYIFVSSATVYKEKIIDEPYSEIDEIGNKEWDYCYSKSECEWYLMKHKNEIGSEYTIVRPYVTYGATRMPFQIAPIEYYTIINRILCDKPILVMGRETKCTVTSTKDFAVGILGLFGNKDAFSEAVHITANHVTTWGKIIEILGRQIGKNVLVVDISQEYLQNVKEIGFEFAELSGDKGRNMVFDNSKIKRLAPEFIGDIEFSQAVPEILKYYEEHLEKRIINYIWDGRIDNLIIGYYKQNKMSVPSNIKLFHVIIHIKSKKDLAMYVIGRITFLYNFCKWSKTKIRGRRNR